MESSVVQGTQECTHVLAGNKKAHNKTHDEKHIDDKEKLKVRMSKILKLRMKLLRIVRSR